MKKVIHPFDHPGLPAPIAIALVIVSTMIILAGCHFTFSADDDSTPGLSYKNRKTSKSSAGAPWVISGGASYPD